MCICVEREKFCVMLSLFHMVFSFIYHFSAKWNNRQTLASLAQKCTSTAKDGTKNVIKSMRRITYRNAANNNFARKTYNFWVHLLLMIFSCTIIAFPGVFTSLLCIHQPMHVVAVHSFAAHTHTQTHTSFENTFHYFSFSLSNFIPHLSFPPA